MLLRKRHIRSAAFALVALAGFTAPAAAEDIRCGACGARPEQIIKTYGPPDNDVLAACDVPSDSPGEMCRRLTYIHSFPKETHRLSFVKREALVAFVVPEGLSTSEVPAGCDTLPGSEVSRQSRAPARRRCAPMRAGPPCEFTHQP